MKTRRVSVILSAIAASGCAIIHENEYNGFYSVSCQDKSPHEIAGEVERLAEDVASILQRPLVHVDEGIPEGEFLGLKIYYAPFVDVTFSYAESHELKAYDILVRQAGYEERDETQRIREVLENAIAQSSCSVSNYGVRHSSPFT